MALLILLVWLLLLMVAWPVALLVLFAVPVLWLLSIPFRVVGIALEGLLALLRQIFLLPARLFGYRG
jgi:hypothetical protein